MKNLALICVSVLVVVLSTMVGVGGFNGLAYPVHLSDDPGPPAPPKSGLEFEPATLELGDVPMNQALKLSALLRNHSRDTIKIRNVEAPCSCTTVNLDSMQLPPGGASRLTGFFRSGYSLGSVERTLTAYDTQGRSTLFKLRANVIRQLQWTPSAVTLEPDVLQRTGHSCEFRVSNNSDQPVKLMVPTATEPHDLRVICENLTVEPQSSCRIRVECGSEFVSPVERTLSIHTNHPTEPLLSVPVTIHPKNGITVTPRSIHWGVLTKTQLLAQKNVQMTLDGDVLNSFNVSRVVTPSYLQHVRSVKHPSGRIELHFALADEFSGSNLSGEIGIHLSNGTDSGPGSEWIVASTLGGFLMDSNASNGGAQDLTRNANEDR